MVTKVEPVHTRAVLKGKKTLGAWIIGKTLDTLKSESLLASEVCRAPMENDANGMVTDAGTVVPDPETADGGSQAKCPRELEPPELLGGCGGNVTEEGTQKGFPAEAAPKGVVLT